MANRVFLSPAAVVLLGSIVVTPQLFSQEAACLSPAVSDVSHDYLHPQYFVHVVEITGESNQRWPVYVARASAQGKDSVGPAFIEVDRNSVIRISFAREELLDVPNFRASLQIAASSAGQPLEVPGYAVVGKESPQNRVDIDGGGNLVRWTCAIERDLAEGGAFASAVEAHVRAIQHYRSELQRVRSLRQRADADLLQRRVTLNSLRQQPLLDSAGIAQREDEIRSAERQVDSLSAHIATLQDPVVPVFQPTATQRLAWLRLNSRLTQLSSSAESTTRDGLARVTSFSAPAISQIAGSIANVRLDTLAVVLADPQRVTESTLTGILRDAGIVTAQLAQLQSLTREYHLRREALPQANDPLMLERLMDTEINLASHDLSSGDRITLTFTNALEPNSGHNREMELLLRVRRFGWVSDVNDSFLFLRRQHANYDRTPSVVTKAAQSIPEGGELEVEVPAGVNYTLTPGASLTWTYFSRNRNSFWSWLRLGLGMQVSFPKFETVTYTISRAVGAPVEQVTITQESRSNSFDIAVGPLVTLFDNAVGFSTGRNLMAHDAPYYIGFSVSFVSLAKRAAQLLPSQ